MTLNLNNNKRKVDNYDRKVSNSRGLSTLAKEC